MLHIIVVILKFIGIFLLSFLLFLLLLLLLLLFLPIRYRVQVEYKEKLQGTGWVRWLYPVLEIRLNVTDNRPKMKICLFWISLERWKACFRKKTKKRKKPEEESEPKTEPLKPSEKKEQRKTSGQETFVLPEQEANTPIDSDTDDLEQPKKEEKKLSWWKRFKQAIQTFFAAIKTWFLKLLRYVKKLKEQIQSLKRMCLDWKEKILGFWEKWEQIRKILEQKSTKKGLDLLWRELKKLLRVCKPKKFQLWVRYGTGDSYTLAQHLSILAILYGLCGECLTIEPDWEEKVLLAKGSVKGRIQIFTLLRICIKVITDKNVKQLWKQISGLERS